MLKKNIKTIIAALLFALTMGSVSYAADDAVLLSLISKAKENNPLIGAAHEKTIKAQAAVKEASAKMGPKAALLAAGLWQENEVTVNLPMMGLSLPVISRSVYAAAIGFVQAVYTGGSLTASKEASVLAKDAAMAQECRVVQSVENSVRLSYYNGRRAQAKEKVAQESLLLTKKHLERAETLFRSGLIAKGDVLRTKVAVAEAEMNLIKADNAVQLAQTALERAVGSSVEAALFKTPAATPSAQPEKTAIAESAAKSAYNKRAELKMYDLLSRQADKIAAAAKGQKLPQIMAAGLLSTVDGSNEDLLPDSKTEWRLGVGAYWNIYDGGEITAKTNQAKAQAKELLYMLADMKNIIKMEVTQAQLNLRSAESRLAVAQRRVAESEEDYRITRRRYDERVGTTLDMLDARLALINSRTELIDALYDIEIAKANLAYAMGE